MTGVKDLLFSLLNKTHRYVLTVSAYKSRHRKRRVLRANGVEVGGFKMQHNRNNIPFNNKKL